MSEIDKAIEEAEQNYEHQCELFQSRLRAMYKNSNETTLIYFYSLKALRIF